MCTARASQELGSLEVGLKSAESQKLESFKWKANNIFLKYDENFKI